MVKKTVKEFIDFIAKGNVIDLAVAVVIGTAFGKIVTALVEGIIMPLVGVILPGGDWRESEIWVFKIGQVLSASVDFIIMGFVIFIVVKKLLGRFMPQKAAPPPSTKECPECLEKIPLGAKRCKFCTSEQPAAEAA